MNTLTIKKSSGNLFRTFVKGKNFMTPDLIGYYEIKNGEVELTKGRFMNNILYGVTVVQNNSKQDDLSKCFDAMDEAMEYIETLNKE